MENQVTVIHTAYEDGPKDVATVDVGPNLSGMGALEYAFRATQNYPELWSTGPFLSNGEPNSEYNPDVTFMGDEKNATEVRSTIVGDEHWAEGLIR